MRALALWTQPICATTSGDVVGVEWLTRWDGETTATGLWQWAEHTAQISQLETRILNVLQDRRQASDAPPGIWFINLHPHGVVTTPEFPSALALWSRRLAPVVWELLEHPGWTAPVVQTLAQAGQIALDDWGDGVESTTRLVTWPVRWVKLDRTITRQLMRPDMLAWVRWIQHFAFGGPLSWIAEGVETPEERGACQAAHIPFVQGFGVSPPRPYRTIGW